MITEIDRTKSQVLARDRWHRLTQVHGNVYVSVETDDREHHMTVRKQAQAFVSAHMSPEWRVVAYVGRENYRNVAGYPAWARRYSVAFIG